MARKRNQQKNGLDKQSPTHKKGVLDSGPSPLTTKDRGNVNDEDVGLGEELLNGGHSISSMNNINDMDHVQDGKKSKKKSKKSQRKERKVTDETVKDHEVPCNSEVDKSNISMDEALNMRDESDLPHNTWDNVNVFGNQSNGLHIDEGIKDAEFPETVAFKFMRTAALSVARSFADWVERHKPTMVTLKLNALKARDHVRMKIQHAQPIILRWITHIWNIMLLLFMVWLECTLRGIDSFLRMGTTSFFSIVWCNVLSVIAMVGISKFLFALAVVAAVGLFLGFTLAVVLTGIAGIIFLWFYGSFWTTGLVIFLGGLAFGLSHDRVALFITSVYAAYCAWNYVGWRGLVFGLNLSFISSDALLFLLRNIIKEQRTSNSPPEQAAGVQGESFFSHNESTHASTTDRSPGVPSTSGSDSETTSEDEVVRLLNCMDHYAALGLSRFENIDVSVIKREYRKKAMLVHPDKNMGNEKAAEAFKKLQNAYEVLLDSFKRKEYDDQLRREELLNFFHKYQNTSRQNQGHSFFKSGFAHPEADSEDLLGQSRRIACKKCGFFHLWVYTNKSKSKARWCQECKDFHQAKDGDGWVEQTSQPFFFGILQQVEAPSAYVCAGGKVYDVTEWYICQGMRCTVNTHKPSFQVNTNVVSKNGHMKGTSASGQRGSGIPGANIEETMTEEEFFEWLQNAMQNGMFENFATSSSEGQSPSGSNPKNSGSNNSSSKRKKKGKKQW
ncbi:Molecular chaperone (DnaJ superfamily) [Handroanthus impetiginosus]|uniref:Molecular chaperone (DnaJ superfamily) n=1 Tax=Handroanthus impetiginosus TaxID=429701 RepID=A0A2G9HLD6_9LAMI|nr:Molecular chaperone (DnaJ superfamily) [Handroanthus impetiginosus]